MSDSHSSALILCLDIGGSFTRVARFDALSQTVCDVVRGETPNFLHRPESGADELLDQVFEVAAALGDRALDGCVPDIVVAGYPGPMTPDGVALRSPTILGEALDGPHDVLAKLQRIWPRATVLVLNDVTCAGYSYVARGHRDFCVLAVGSGIGNKIFLDGRPVTGCNGRGGEIGHLVVQPDVASPVGDVIEELGNIASGRGTVELAKRWAQRAPTWFATSTLGGRRVIDSEGLVEAFNAEDELATRIVAAGCQPLASVIGTIHLVLGVESFFIVGGFAKALGRKYLDVLVERLQHTTWDLGQDWRTMIEISSGDSEQALHGAGFLASSMPLQHAIPREAGGIA